MWLVLCVLLVLASGKELTDEEYSRLPRLFHLDDYEACLARRGGLYCLGSFRLKPQARGEAVYTMMEEYSKTPQHFNRTLVHRGYCVSARCPRASERSELSGLSELSELSDRNESWRFERCVERWAHSQGFRSDVHEIEGPADFVFKSIKDCEGVESIVKLDITQKKFNRTTYVMDIMVASPDYEIGDNIIAEMKGSMKKDGGFKPGAFYLKKPVCILLEIIIGDLADDIFQAAGVKGCPIPPYCRTTEQTRARKSTELDTPMIVFTAVAFSVLFVNAVCTAYDWMRPDSEKKNKLLLTWSMKSNWQRLTAHYEDGDPRLVALTPLQGVRVFIMVLVIALHRGLFYHVIYTHNPRSLENMMKLPIMILVRNGTSLVEVFVVLSSFLLAYHLLLHSKTHPLGLYMLPKIWMTRIIRLSPLHLMAVGFAATWWPVLNDGPMWYAVEGTAGACRRKFWTHALYLNNIIDPDDQCLVQTWFLAVDMQLFIVTSVLTLLLARCRRWALVILGALVAASAVVNGLLAYHYEWTTMLYVTSAEYYRVLYRGVPSFKWYYTSAWGSLPASLIGLLLAFLHFDLQEKGFKAAEHKWLVHAYHISIPLVFGFVMLGGFVEHETSRLVGAAYVALERPVYSLICMLCLFGMVNNIDNIARKFFAWRGFHVLGRMTLAALLLHWFLDLSLLAASPLPLTHSGFVFVYGFVSTVILTYVFAVPLTVMVEMPFQRSFSAIFA